MKRRLSARIFFFGFEMMRPILGPVFWVLDRTYKLLFGRRDLRSSIEREEKLRHEILGNLPFLFEEYGGHLSRYESSYKFVQHPRPFDYTFAVVVLHDFSLLFFRGRGEFRVRVAPNPSPSAWNAWEDLELVLSIIDEGFERREFKSFAALKAVLEPRMKLLQEALSPNRYPQLMPQLANVHAHDRAITRQWETEINRRLYPDK